MMGGSFPLILLRNGTAWLPVRSGGRQGPVGFGSLAGRGLASSNLSDEKSLRKALKAIEGSLFMALTAL